jgi:hypothetical protein
MRNALIYILLLLFSASLSAHAGQVDTVKGAFLEQLQKRDSVLIADQLRYGFELHGLEDGTQLLLPEIPQEQGYGLMYLSPWTLDTLKVTKQKKGGPSLLDIRGSVVVTSFEEGVCELPRIVLGRMSGGVTDTLVFESMSLDVKTIPVDTATFQPYDIKGQIRYPVTFAEVLPWVLGGIGVAALIALCIYLIRRRRNAASEERHKDPAHIVALRKLDQYRGNSMWIPEKQKQFYSGVTDTLREYMASRYGISAMEMTTAEIFDGMKSSDVPSDLLAVVKELFERADFVKFAKYVASEEDNASVLPVAVRFVTETYQAELEEEEAAATNETEGGE